ncbi:hypothetical protein RN001_011857 [Aquatica leii]|uniref:Uncharacterized protein n=1 Tax=Aquatica leii TaxID=1421715 RepID=A0AAN7Q150_9COLE|nr:hypothetical protein RN001_011857 [Aquatica leii]
MLIFQKIAENKKNAYKTGGGTFIKKSTPLDQKIVTTLKPQFTPLPNRYDSSTSYIDPQPSCSSKHTPTACNMVTNTVLTYDVVPSGDLQLVTPDSPLFTEDFPEFVETEVEEVISANTDISELSHSQPGAKGMKRKIVGSNSQPAKKKPSENIYNRFCNRKNFKDEKDEEIHKYRLECLKIEKTIKERQLMLIEQQIKQEKEIHEIKKKDLLEEIEFKKKK